MKMHPPAQVNARVTEEMLRWIMSQPIIVTIPKGSIPKGMNVSNEFIVTPGKDAQEYPIDDRTKQAMLHELQRILSFHRFASELLDNGSLKISKERWTLEVDNILGQLPFTDAFLAQIENSYNHHVQDAAFNEMIYSGGVMMQVDYGHPRPSHFIDMRAILEDFISDADKIDHEALKAFDDANLSIGQVWTHQQQGYEVKITYLSREVAGVKFEELATGRIGAFCIEIFLERFSYKDSSR